MLEFSIPFYRDDTGVSVGGDQWKLAVGSREWSSGEWCYGARGLAGLFVHGMANGPPGRRSLQVGWGFRGDSILPDSIRLLGLQGGFNLESGKAGSEGVSTAILPVFLISRFKQTAGASGGIQSGKRESRKRGGKLCHSSCIPDFQIQTVGRNSIWKTGKREEKGQALPFSLIS